ncbi:MAG TPA: AAA family ATPase, partial [Acidimicrobiales bacterium]
MTAGPARSGVSTATVLFTDVIDSTPKRIQLGEAAADQVFADHDRMLRAVARAHRAAFVKGVGDGVMAVFDSAAAALAAGVAIERAVQEDNRIGRVPLEIRVGLSAGDVSWHGDDVHGLPVVEASRLCASARAGEMLCAAIAAHLAFGREALAFLDRGTMELKGIDRAVPVVEVVWRDATPPRARLIPTWLAADDRVPFVGRGSELTALGNWLAGRGGPAIVVTGPPGAGKSRLLAEVAGTLVDPGRPALFGHCTDPPTRPFQPLAEGLTRFAEDATVELFRSGADADLVELARLAPALSALVPTAPDVVATDDSDAGWFRLVGAFGSFVRRLGAQRPALLVVDDLQWASAASVRLLSAMLREVPSACVRFLASMRDSRLETDAGTRRELDKLLALPGVLTMPLSPLAAGEIASALDGVWPGERVDTRPVAERLARTTGGNAFFVTESIRAMVDAHDLSLRSVPGTVTQMVVARAEGLSPLARELVAIVACSDGVEAAVLGHALGAPGDELAAAVEQAVDAGLVADRPTGVAISHELARDALTSGLSSVRRAALHQRLLSSLQAVHPSVGSTRPYEVAEHLTAIAALGAEDALEEARDAAVRAAAHATEHAAHAEASRWQTRAVELHDRLPTPSGALRAQLLLGLGEMRWRAGERGARSTILDAAREALAADCDDLVVQAALAADRGFFSATAAVDHELVAVTENALARTSPDATATRAELLARLASELTWAPDGERRFALADEALALARASGDLRTLVRVLVLRNLTIAAADTVTERLRACAELAAAAERVDDDLLRFHALFQQTGPLLEVGDTPAVSEL